ncbi:chitinase [Aequitasia blattaphilus]|uniref:Carbohydrate-binding protein n=1 Tax=Aequitasia blattaphilus TaxID=2949332 RepID=A0ABT1E501_9FIRM|nr:carbohydrate-binding protein [Aequitasia blattaphilus]MCP1100913.1 carbohydrate-binding protein [Aequitasia blattaphilus]MCR8613553.1 carbohydrate-binding protein [Aequitasia blattaphilus]
MEKKKKRKRKLAWSRLLIVCLILGVAGTGYFYRDVLSAEGASESEGDVQPWFASYVDATLTPEYPFEKRKDNVVLSFVVADDKKEPSWGNAYTLQEAAEDLDLERRIARLRQNGGEVIVSFGGLLNKELALVYEDTDALKKAYESVINTYDISTIDLDLEQEGLANKEAGKRRGEALAKLQKERAKKGNELAIWVTLPVIPQGLTEEGTAAIETLLDAGVDLAGVNIMTMNYGEARDEKLSMAENSINALKKTHRQLRIIYQEDGIRLSDQALWKKLGATPMIGQNDVATEIFTLKDAKKLNDYAQEVGLGRLSMWSANRDSVSNENSVGNQVVSNYYSGVVQESYAYADALSKHMKGSIAAGAKQRTVSDITKDEVNKADDPETSPYEIWSEYKAYLADTKVVWRRNVYRAKWWTKGDMPDAPVLQESAIPWELVGPVMPGEKPIENVSLPKGHYMAWDEAAEYHSGDRVMYGGNAYEAKWWNQGENPEKSISGGDDVPWQAISQDEIKKIVRGDIVDMKAVAQPEETTEVMEDPAVPAAESVDAIPESE